MQEFDSFILDQFNLITQSSPNLT